MFERVLCAIDGSQSAERAVDFAARVAKQTGAELRFITVSTVSPQSAARTYYWDDRLFRAGEQQIALELSDAVERARAAGVDGATAVTVAGRDIASAIIGYARENGYDHIVMGSTGHSAFGQLLAGSVVSDVLKQPHPPVTVI